MKKIISFLLSIVMLVSTIAYIDLSAYAVSSGDFRYNVLSETGKTCKITEYTGSATELEISSQLDGYTVTSIGDYTFQYCDSLTSITIPNSVKNIGNFAFVDCTSLTNIKIPDSVTSIGAGAFENCSSLTSVAIPNGVTSIGASIFENCSSLASVAIPNGVTSIGASAFKNCSSLTSVAIPNGVTSIGASAFKNCNSLTNVAIPNGVTSIGGSAFLSCDSLTSVTIGNSVTSIGGSAFSGTKYYNDVENWENEVLYIGKFLIKAKDTISGSYAIKDGTKVIADYAFVPFDVDKGHRNDLTGVAIPNSVTSIGDHTFYNCDKLTSVTIPDSVTSIGGSAFCSCNSLANVTIGNSVTSIGASAFKNCSSLTSITIPDSVTSIGYYAFGDCSSLASITIPDSVTSIGGSAFLSCDSLTSVTIPDSVTSIGDYAFKYCTSLINIKIPNSVTSIGESAFSTCDSLTSVTIPNSVTSIGECAFSSCISLTNLTIPDSVTSIGRYAFGYCINLTSVTISNSIANIGDQVFQDCHNLKSITIPNSVTNVGKSAFNCTSLTDVYYSGSEADWKKISIGSNNECLTKATIHYNSTMPPTFVEKQLRFENELYLMNVNDTKELKPYLCDVYLDNGNIVFENKEFIDASKLNWSTNVGEENKVISFDQGGKVTALSEGLAYISAYVKDDINLYASCQIYVGNPNSLNYKTTYDTKQYYADGGFFSQTSSMSDCVELYCLFENKLAEELQPIQDKLSLDDLSDISPITLTATVSGNDLSFNRNSYQNTYRVTLDSISAGKAVDDILMLFPYNINIVPSGNSYTVKIVLESDSFETVTEEYKFTVENIENKSANEHIAFTSNNCDYITSKNNYYGNSMVSLKDDSEYKWSKYSSFDFKNYYEIVLADILIEVLNVNQVEMPSLVPTVLKEWVGTYKTLLGGITTIVKDDYTGTLDISETKIDKLLKKSKYSTEGVYKNDELYQTVLDLLGNADNAEKITKVFSTIDKTQQAVGFIKLGKNIIKDAVEWGNRLTLLNECANANAEFKEVMQKFADSIPDNQKKMKEAVYDYINYSADMSGQMNELLESFSQMLGNVTLDVFKSCIGKSLFNYLGIQVFNWIGSITLASGVVLSATPAFAGVQTAFGAFFTGATLGLCLSDVLCDSSGKSQEMSKVVAMSEFSPYVIDTLNCYESNLYKQRNDETVDVFEYSFALHKATQSYIMNHTVKALEIKRDSLIIKIFGRDDYDGLISDILAQKAVIDNLKCHSSGEASETLSVKTKVIAIKCPVNVFFYDNTGKEIVRIVDGVKEYVADDINVLVDGDKKYIALPATQNYSTKIVATDEGTMEYLVTEYDEGAQRSRSINKTNISLVPDKTFTSDVPEGLDLSLEEYALTNDEELILPDTIIDNPITGVELNYKNLDLTIGEKSKLTATVTPVNVTNPKVRWISDEPSIANVDDNGNITAFSTGTTTIYVITEDWGYVDICTVSVSCIHSYDSGKVTKSATCTEPGIKTYTCKICGEKNTESIDVISHDFGDNRKFCSVCGADNPNYNEQNPSGGGSTGGGGSIGGGGGGGFVPAPTPEEPTTEPTTQPSTKPSVPTTTTAQSSIKKPKSTSIKKLTKGTKSFKVTWKKKTGVSGYQVQYATDKKFKKNKKTVTIAKKNATSKTIKKLKSKKTYYVRGRTYKIVNGKKVYSSWSKVKAVKTK